MSHSAAILRTGEKIRTTFMPQESLLWDIDGFLIHFEIENKKYRFYNKSSFDFSSSNKYFEKFFPGYFPEENVLTYYSGEPISQDYFVTNIVNQKFDIQKPTFQNYKAQPEDIISIKIVEYDAHFLYRTADWTFPVQTLEIPAIQNGAISLPDLTLPDVTREPSEIFPGQTLRDFYQVNYSSHIQGWVFEDEEVLNQFTRIATLICFKIAQIKKDVFDHEKFAELVNVQELIESTPPIESLSTLEKVIYYLLVSWKYIEDSSTVYKPLFGAEPDFELYLNYYNGLINLYNALYLNLYRIPQLSQNDLLLYLLDVLPLSSISALDFETKKLLIKKIASNQVIHRRRKYSLPIYTDIVSLTAKAVATLAENVSNVNANDLDEVNLLKIIKSVKPENSQKLMDFFLSKEDAASTMFQMIYKKFTDNRLARYPFMEFFVGKEENRFYFCLATYNHWKITDYNFYYLPPDATIIDEEINQESFYLNAGIKYVETENGLSAPSLHFTEVKLDEGVGTQNIKYKATKDLGPEGDIVTINKITTTTRVTSTSYANSGTYVSTTSTYRIHGQYHLLQPIHFYGYKASLDLISEIEHPEQIGDPNDPANMLNPIDGSRSYVLPAFLFYYTTEYRRLKNFDSAVSFAIEVGIEVGLFFVTGGASSLAAVRHVRHIRTTSKIGRFFRAASKPGAVRGPVNSLTIWTRVTATAEVVSLSSSILFSFTQYVSNTTLDPKQRRVANTLGYIFMVGAIAGGITSIASQRRAVNNAKVIKENPELLQNLGMSSDEIDDLLIAISKIADSTIGDIIAFQQRLPDGLLTKFNQLNEADQLKFMDDFFEANPSDFDIILQNGGFEKWQELATIGVPQVFRKNLKIIADAECL